MIVVQATEYNHSLTELRMRLCEKEVCLSSRAGKVHLCDTLPGTDAWRVVVMRLDPRIVCVCLSPYWTLCSATFRVLALSWTL